MPKKRKNPERVLRQRLKDMIDRDRAKADDYRDNHERVPNLPVDQRYRVDPEYSRIPTAICGNVVLLGLINCGKGVGKYCYCKTPCGNQYSLTTTDFLHAEHVSRQAKAISDYEMQEALAHAREVMATQRPEMETDIDEIVTYLMQSIQDEELI